MGLAQQERNNSIKAKQYYLKAKKHFDNGDLEKAIELCNSSISESVKNTSALNLKGLIYYLRGDITSCQKIWDLNYDLNNDKVSKFYLDNLKTDKKNMDIFVDAKRAMQNDDFVHAIDLLESVKENSFNSINVFRELAIASVSIGEIEYGIIYARKVLELDKSVAEARDLLKKYDKSYAHNRRLKALLLMAFLVSAVLIGVMIYKFVISKNLTSPGSEPSITKNDPKKKTDDVSEKDKDKGKKPKEEKESKEKPVETPINIEELRSFINNKDIVNMEKVYNDNKGKNLGVTERELLEQVLKILKFDGVAYFYKNGTSLFKAGDYPNAKINFEIGSRYFEDHYLKAHIMYFKLQTYKALGDYENYIIEAEDYIEQFKQGTYIQTVLYEAAIFYKEKDLEKAKKYAEILQREHSRSNMNNNNIKAILAS